MRDGGVGTAVYDVIVVGGGIGGTTFARALAKHGVRVLVLEREIHFKDRVRGEQMHPWGVADARELGVFDLLRSHCGHELPWFDRYLGSERIVHRDLRATTPQSAPEFTFYHPAMQEILLQAAADAGAHVRRGAHVRDVRPGTPPEVVVAQDGRIETLQARLVVGADGRTSMTRRWGRFTVRRDPERLLLAGLLFDDMSTPEDTSLVFTTSFGRTALLFPQGNGRVRAYFVCQHGDHRLQGDGDIPRFVMENVRAGVPAEYYAKSRAAGPLATFDAADTWVDHPYAEGVALIGDAGASNDPSYGEGLSLTLRDVRVLRDALLRDDDWETAGRAYAKEHDRHYGVIHTVTGWFGDIFYAVGTEAEARRARALPLIARDRMRVPDHIVSGPDLPLSETTRRRFFGEE